MECGWLSPDGEIVKCEQWEHMEKAFEIMPNSNMPDEDLLSKGWIKIGTGLFGIRVDMASDIATELQKEYLEKLYYETIDQKWDIQGLRNLYYCGVVDDLKSW